MTLKSSKLKLNNNVSIDPHRSNFNDARILVDEVARSEFSEEIRDMTMRIIIIKVRGFSQTDFSEDFTAN